MNFLSFRFEAARQRAAEVYSVGGRWVLSSTKFFCLPFQDEEDFDDFTDTDDEKEEERLRELEANS